QAAVPALTRAEDTGHVAGDGGLFGKTADGSGGDLHPGLAGWPSSADFTPSRDGPLPLETPKTQNQPGSGGKDSPPPAFLGMDRRRGWVLLQRLCTEAFKLMCNAFHRV